jgi:transglutaminase-like putative cysteine protease
VTRADAAAALPGSVPATALTALQMQALALLLAGCVVAHGQWLPLPLTLFLLVMIGARIGWHRLVGKMVPALIRAPLLLMTLAIVFVLVGSPVGRDGGAATLLALAALKLVESVTVRDGRMLVAAVFFIAMTVFLFGQGLFTTIYIGVLSVFAFAILTLLRKYPDGAASSRSLGAGVRGAMHSVARIALAALPLAAAGFVFFPRLAEPLWGAPWRGNEGVSGIGDEMRPGMLSRLWMDDTPVFRASFAGRRPNARELYWRGPVLTDFDGQTWSRARPHRTHGGVPFRYSPDSVVRYEVLLEPTEKNWYFPLDLPLHEVSGTTLLNDGQMITDKPIIAPKRLEFESATEFVFDEVPDRVTKFAALRLPVGSNPRAVALAREWRAQGKSDAEVIDAALKMFNAAFTYSLEPPPLAPERSVDDFLFETRTGYCEHYSSSFAFLMRAAGIPTRVVTGYLGGYWNRGGNYFLVRKSDAHAWTEVWLQGRGWVRTDPTGAVAPERILRGNNAEALPEAARWYHSNWAAGLVDRSDRIARWWRQRIVDYDALRQRQVLNAFGVGEADLQHLVGALALIGGLAMAAGAWWSMRGLRRRERDPLLRAWRRFGRRLAEAGVERGDNEGPIAYARRAAGRLPHSAQQVIALGTAFARLRYDPSAAGDEAAHRSLRRALRAFRVRKSPRV